MGPSSSDLSFRLMAAETVIAEDCCDAASSAKLPAVPSTNEKRRLATTSLLPMDLVSFRNMIEVPSYLALIRFLPFRRCRLQGRRRRRRRSLCSLAVLLRRAPAHPTARVPSY